MFGKIVHVAFAVVNLGAIIIFVWVLFESAVSIVEINDQLAKEQDTLAELRDKRAVLSQNLRLSDMFSRRADTIASIQPSAHGSREQNSPDSQMHRAGNLSTRLAESLYCDALVLLAHL